MPHSISPAHSTFITSSHHIYSLWENSCSPIKWALFRLHLPWLLPQLQGQNSSALPWPTLLIYSLTSSPWKTCKSWKGRKSSLESSWALKGHSFKKTTTIVFNKGGWGEAGGTGSLWIRPCVIPVLGRWRQEDQEPKVILCSIQGPAWVTWDHALIYTPRPLKKKLDCLEPHNILK